MTEEEYTRVEACAFGQGISISEWCRSVLLQSAQGDRPTEAEKTLLAEVLALRMILLNLLFTVARGETMTTDDMQTIIDRADGAKASKAASRLSSPNREVVSEVQ
ncbi:MAG: hypothetical protein WCC21_12465 [Candidatus Acidiferrales bacterium]